MTEADVLNVVEYYETVIRKGCNGRSYWGISACKYDRPDNKSPWDEEALEHALWMCSQTQEFCKERENEKALRWLGFIQGVLWMTGVFTIDDLRKHNTGIF